MVIDFIDDHRAQFGVEPICRTLSAQGCRIAPSTYYAAQARARSARAERDAALLVEVQRVFGARDLGRGLAGARKVWHLLNRDTSVTARCGRVARCTVERLMRRAGLQGARRGRRWVTTKADPAAIRPPDLVKRDFSARAPNQLWLVDFTYIPTWSQTVFTAFVSDAFSRRIVGWRTSSSMPTELPLDALEMALWTRERAGHTTAAGRLEGLIHHSDAGSQYTAIRYTQRISEIGAVASIGTVGDSYDNALAESVIGLYKTECVRHDGPFRTVDDLELATLAWVHWFNEQRLHSSIGHVPPVEFEDHYYRENTPRPQPLLGQPALH